MGRGISYCATCDGMFFKDLEVAVIGGGDSALTEALTLANIAARVYIVHRRDEFRAQRILLDRAAKNSRIQFLLNKVPVEIKGRDQVESVMLKDTVTKEGSELPVSGVFFMSGPVRTPPLSDILSRPTHQGSSSRTSIWRPGAKGMFAAGDVRKKSLRQISTAVGDGALAAVNLEKYVLETR